MTPKPIFLGPKYAEQFRDVSVAAAYRRRPKLACSLHPEAYLALVGRRL